ncbi:MAG: ABC transporter permease subunit [Chloroflexi bacterium]|jgi:multiple sugar transport system permease protein|nr:ABC transporter permease subunit [Chloroflexota bacterium]
MDNKTRKKLSGWGNTFAGILILIFIAFPIFWIAVTAFKPERYVFSTEIRFAPTLDSFRAIFQDPLAFGPLTVNSLIVSTVTVLIAVPLAVMAAYAFSRYRFKGDGLLLIWVLITQFLPPVVVVLPFFALFRQLGLVDTRMGLVWINLSIVLPYSIWMIKGFVDALPTEIEQAALIDGANEFQTIRHITMPLLMPSIITAAVFSFIIVWNEFLFALILTRQEARTLTIGLLSTNTATGIRWDWMSATGLIVMIPVFILSLTIRKHFVQGMTMGAVK